MNHDAIENPFKGIALSESALTDEDLDALKEQTLDTSFKATIAYKKNSADQLSVSHFPLKQNRLSPVKAIDARELISMELPPKELIMSPWLPLRGIAMVYAPRGIGKTFFALEVACAVAKGTAFLTWATK